MALPFLLFMGAMHFVALLKDALDNRHHCLSISRDLVLSWSAAIASEEPVGGVGTGQ
jgi:hypothetical protein